MSDEPMEVDTASAGSKRKADDDLLEARAPRRIKALDQSVVNKIAAGEIIIAPVHALKELIENAVDAGSTSIEILVKDGGLKLLQITDNGCGIQKEDLTILCERHTTSKISTFEDLTSIATYGFRGEALASISHIAHLAVTTKTAESDVAWRAHFLDGVLAPAKAGQPADPKPTAGRVGTQISVEDLFYNIPTRRRAFRSVSDEYNKIIDMVGRYAIHCEGVAFSCRKQGEAGTSVSIQKQAETIDRIRQIYGSNVANELMEFNLNEKRHACKANGWATNANYHIKKTTFLLFINHRAVESTSIRKSIEQVYASYLPKNGRPFVYLNLDINPAHVDVNVHPTKREVHFLDEDQIVQSVCEHIRSKLAAVDTSRTFLTQTLLPGASLGDQLEGDDEAQGTPRANPSGSKKPRRNSNSLIRTDTSSRKITSMFTTVTDENGNQQEKSALRNDSLYIDPERIHYETNPDREYTRCELTSIKALREIVRDNLHESLNEIFANHTFVGIVDDRRRLAAIQSGIKLYVVDYGRTCFEFFYQLGLTDFGNFGIINLNPPLDVRQLVHLAATKDGKLAEQGVDPEEATDRIVKQLIDRRELLSEYLSLEITPNGQLNSIPLMIKGYSPPFIKLPMLLYRLGPFVDWTEEQACFRSMLRELAQFYVPEQMTHLDHDWDVNPELPERRKNLRWAVEHIFFAAFKNRLVATKGLIFAGAVLEVADLKGLYRVFERC